MLTQSQLEQLEPLTKYPKYGILLKDAIETWKHEDVTPCFQYFGIYYDYTTSTFVFCNNELKQCCLVAAAIMEKSSHLPKLARMTRDRFIFEYYDILDHEYESLWRGFDDEDIEDSEAWKFGNKIKNIINPSRYIFTNLNKNQNSSCVT